MPLCSLRRRKTSRERLSSCAFCPYNVAVTASAVTVVGGARAEPLPGHFSASQTAKGHSVMARVGPGRPTGGPSHRCIVTQGTWAWSTGARATSWSRLEYPDNLKFLVQEISGLKIKIRTEFLAIFCILNTFFRQARTARHRTAAGPRGHGGPDGDIPTALMPRTLGTVSSSTLVGNSDKWCVGRARPRVARSASRRVSI